jgi:hypothetical protein
MGFLPGSDSIQPRRPKGIDITIVLGHARRITMPNFVHILLRVLAGIAGALPLYVAFFLYEDKAVRKPCDTGLTGGA